MPVRAVDDKSSDTLVVVSEEGFWTGSSTLPHLHQPPRRTARDAGVRDRFASTRQDVAAPWTQTGADRPTYEHLMTDLPDSTSDDETTTGETTTP